MRQLQQVWHVCRKQRYYQYLLLKGNRIEIGRFFKEVYLKIMPVQMVILVALVALDRITNIWDNGQIL